MAPRFFCPMPLLAHSTVDLPSTVAHHAERVLRLAPGDALTLFNGEGGEFPARLLALGKAPRAELGEYIPDDRESPLPITLVQSLASGDKMDWVLQKAVELGAFAIVPVASQRSVVKLSGDRAQKRVEHWQKIVASACEQCGRNRLPDVADLRRLASHMAQAPEPGTLRLILAPGAALRPADLPRPAAVELLVGPEGGFTEDEVLAAGVAGYRALRLGPRILRTETAGLAALTALQVLWGDMS
ncbi:MAG: 16S rRNA (uracil(1498)-N(3))-methyltransferase [Rhodocyclaceae bacterium]|nr:16S rRNA (uracil(1498)-N(3))-methyltransferase [Rhodocyclaceae bacterium]